MQYRVSNAAEYGYTTANLCNLFARVSVVNSEWSIADAINAINYAIFGADFGLLNRKHYIYTQ